MKDLKAKYQKFHNTFKKSDKKARNSRWIVSYADFVTVLLGVFIVLFVSNGKIDLADLKAVANENNSKADIETLISDKKSAGGENLLLDGVKNPSQSKEISVLEFEAEAKKLIDAFGGQDVKVINKNGQITIRFGEGVLFDEGSAIIKQSSKKTLDILSKELSNGSAKVRIEGHCDNLPIKNGQYSSNWELSTMRATNIVSYLIENGKVDKNRLSAAGYADNKPVKSNATEDGRAQNRRVDVVITKTE